MNHNSLCGVKEMNKILITCSLALSSLLLANSQVHAEERLQIIDRGTDGDVRYYSVVCPSSKRTSVSHHYEKGEVCTMLVSRLEKVCRTDWDVDTAAKEACN